MKTLFLINKIIRYNLKIIFGNKFIYFLLGALAVFLFFTVINIFEDINPMYSTVYEVTLFPSILLIFYPTVFGIQNDDDARILEILFGIPNYRYKVWLVRLLLIFAITFLVLIAFCYIANLAIFPINAIAVAAQLMFPIIFLGCTAFMVSTIVKSGNGTAVVMIILGIFFMISAGVLERSSWNIFLNPFDQPFQEMNEVVWERTVTYNRIYLMVGAVITTLIGLINMQNREKFV